MSAALTLATAQNADSVLSLMARYHAEAELPFDDEHRAVSAVPLLEESPLGAIWLIGPPRAPLGYVMFTFGWSIAAGGMTAHLEEAFIRPSVRNRQIGTEAVNAVMVQLSQAGIRAFAAAPLREASRAVRFCERLRLNIDDSRCHLTS